jgi:ATP-binding cassette, subfamily B, multidrug efflux pump
MMSDYHEDEILGKAYDGRLMRRLWVYTQPHRGLIRYCLILSLVVVIAELSLPKLKGYAFDNYILKGDLTGLLKICSLYFVLLLVILVLNYKLFITMFVIGQKIMYTMRMQIFDHIQSLSLHFFDTNPVGRLITRVVSDVDILTEMFATVIVTSIRDIIVIFGVVCCMFYLNVKLAAATMTILPLLFIVSFVFRKKVRTLYRDARIKIAKLSAYLQENIIGIKTVQAFCRQRRNLDKYNVLNWEIYDIHVKTILCYALYFPVVEFLGYLGTAIVVCYGGYLMIGGGVSYGDLVAFIFYVEMFFRPIRNLSQRYNTMQAAMASSERIFYLLDTKPDIVDKEEPKVCEAVGEIEFQNVWFAYSEEEWVLKDVSFIVAPGQATALVGATGAGKTTIIALLLRYYDIQKGRILLNGVDIREYDTPSLRRRISLVQQDLFIFSGTVYDNITLSDESFKEEAVEAAARHVNAHRFISRRKPDDTERAEKSSLAGGYFARAHERGAGYSVGEKQLLSFARALVADPEVLVLDEATSNVDTETERLIQQALANLMTDRTSIVVAHRLSTIERADQILVLHKGEIRERGTHQQLLEHGGLYFRLYQLQYKDQEKKTELQSGTD